jgi:hypothetical protein
LAALAALLAASAAFFAMVLAVELLAGAAEEAAIA